MVKKQFDDQLVAQWIQLRRKGEPYRSIGRTFDVDPRTVKSWIQRAGVEKEQEHWEAVSRQVDTKYLDEHYRMLLQIAAALLEAVHTDPVSAYHTPDARVLFSSSAEVAVRMSAELLKGRGLDMSSAVSEFSLPSGVKDAIAKRLGHKLLDALMEHEPRLEEIMEEWGRGWAEFQKERSKLVEAAENLFKHAGASDKIAEALKRGAVREVLGASLLKEDTCSSFVDDIDENRANLIRQSKQTGTIVYSGLKLEVRSAQDAYGRVFPQLSHPGRIGPVEDSYHSLVKQLREVEDYVDQLILMGKPRGQCGLCLHQSIHLT